MTIVFRSRSSSDIKNKDSHPWGREIEGIFKKMQTRMGADRKNYQISVSQSKVYFVCENPRGGVGLVIHIDWYIIHF